MTGMRTLCLAILIASPLTGAAAQSGVQVLDGVTIVVGDKAYRLSGIDTPNPGEPYYEAARQRLRELVAAGELRCLPTGEPESYGRTVAICRAGGRDVAYRLIAEGLAPACHTQMKGREYSAAERVAQYTKRGIWATGFQRRPFCRPTE